VPALPGCISEGDTVEDALANIQEAIEIATKKRAPERVEMVPVVAFV
jgi:predicted RNase H-like HicB family nuclease